MSFLGVLVLLGTGLMTNCETHSLMYIYSALSQPVYLPGIHQFIAMGLLDDRTIDYYDSVTQRKIPKQDWMKELPADYWKTGTEARKGKQQWFIENIKILMEQMRQNDSVVHVLQWRHGCEGEEQPGGSVKLIHAVDMYSYDGDMFLSFSYTSNTWVHHSEAAELTKRKWNELTHLREYTREYLGADCIDFLRGFMGYWSDQLKEASPPKVHMFVKNSNVKTNIILTCLATGFLPREIDLVIKRDGRILTKADGGKSTGTLPNGDDTFQRRDSIEIYRDDPGTYTCHVSHKASSFNLHETWDKVLPPEEGSGSQSMIAVGVVVALLVVAGLALAFILYKKTAGPADHAAPGADDHILASGLFDQFDERNRRYEDDVRGSQDSGVSTFNEGNATDDDDDEDEPISLLSVAQKS